MTQHDRKSRRRHSAQLKAQVLGECAEAGASVAAIALSHGLNANLVRQWLRGRGVKRSDAVVSTPVVRACSRKLTVQQFLPVTVPARPADLPQDAAAAVIAVEVHRGPLRVHVSWPQSGGAQCAAWLRELLR